MRALFLCILCNLGFFLHGKEPIAVNFFEIPSLGSYSIEGIGAHLKQNRHALNISAGILDPDPLSPFMFHAQTQYILYPKKEGFFLGSGLGILREPQVFKHSQGFSPTFESTLGYEWQTNTEKKFFVEASTVVPFQKPHSSRVWPNLSLGFHF